MVGTPAGTRQVFIGPITGTGTMAPGITAIGAILTIGDIPDGMDGDILITIPVGAGLTDLITQI